MFASRRAQTKSGPAGCPRSGFSDLGYLNSQPPGAPGPDFRTWDTSTPHHSLPHPFSCFVANGRETTTASFPLQAISPLWHTIHAGQKASTMNPTSIAAAPTHATTRLQQPFPCQKGANKGHLRALKNTSNFHKLIFFKHLTGNGAPPPSPPPHSGCEDVSMHQPRIGLLCVFLHVVCKQFVQDRKSSAQVLLLAEEQAQ